MDTARQPKNGKEPLDPEFVEFIGERLIVGNFKSWSIAVADPVEGRVEPTIRDYLKYYREYLFFHSEATPTKEGRKNPDFRFFSRLARLAKRACTGTLKPSQPWRDQPSAWNAENPDTSDPIYTIGRRLIIGNFDDWTISVTEPMHVSVEPAIGDYIKYCRSFLYFCRKGDFYKKGSPSARRPLNSLHDFVSGLLHLLKRAFTRSLKPAQLWAESSTDKKAVPRSSHRTDTSCVPPQSGQTTEDNCEAQSSKAV